jgi:hypothetical protein
MKIQDLENLGNYVLVDQQGIIVYCGMDTLLDAKRTQREAQQVYGKQFEIVAVCMKLINLSNATH